MELLQFVGVYIYTVMQTYEKFFDVSGKRSHHSELTIGCP